MLLQPVIQNNNKPWYGLTITGFSALGLLLIFTTYFYLLMLETSDPNIKTASFAVSIVMTVITILYVLVFYYHNWLIIYD